MGSCCFGSGGLKTGREPLLDKEDMLLEQRVNFTTQTDTISPSRDRVTSIGSCWICSRDILSESESLFLEDGVQFHKECFLCEDCVSVLQIGTCVIAGDHFLCRTCAQIRQEGGEWTTNNPRFSAPTRSSILVEETKNTLKGHRRNVTEPAIPIPPRRDTSGSAPRPTFARAKSILDVNQFKENWRLYPQGGRFCRECGTERMIVKEQLGKFCDDCGFQFDEHSSQDFLNEKPDSVTNESDLSILNFCMQCGSKRQCNQSGSPGNFCLDCGSRYDDSVLR